MPTKMKPPGDYKAGISLLKQDYLWTSALLRKDMSLSFAEREKARQFLQSDLRRNWAAELKVIRTQAWIDLALLRRS
jgi:hypothetical protein